MIVETKFNVTDEQLRKMRHAIGLNYKKRPYRNYFYSHSLNSDWEDLIGKGLADKCKGWTEDSVYYYLTFEGVKFVYGKPFSKKAYTEL